MKRFLLTAFVEMTLSFNIYSRTLIINLDVSTMAGCSIVDARFIARSLLSRQGWERLCGAGAPEHFPASGGDLWKPHAPRGAGGAEMPVRPKPHSSGQPGGRGVSGGRCKSAPSS